MTKIVALNKEEHGNMRCKTNMGYHFAAKDAVMVLGLQELPKAALALPIGIIKQGDQYMTAALQGLQPQQNLLVNPEGKWRASYIPAAYRAYPFVLATEGERTILCMRDPDTYLSATEGRELFDGDEPSQGVRELIQFLHHAERDRALMLKQCALLQQFGLIEPWPLTLKRDGRDTTVSDLYRVNERALAEVSADVLDQLRQALPLIYCQLLSMQHIHALAQLAQRVEQAKLTEQQDDDKLNLDFLSDDDGTLKFH